MELKTALNQIVFSPIGSNMIHFTVDSLQFSFTKINHDKNQSRPTGKPETQHFGVVFFISASVKSTKPKV